ncbi:MAG: lipid IV(A) 3-deoxy-D-manno-octulosonic acid transferase [Gammaproteobacteria bacterium]|jgi:3-deoxy-D-manno-octulosonic-acid transferase|nr:lipid IV(A) 3-deoxy-D-manno-octulosonic acid transferase [Gammaproteobacteria bacterium]
MHILLRLIYSVATYLLVPLVLLHLYWKGFGNPAYRLRIPERFGFYAGRAPTGVIWVHAVSVGEVQAAAALVRELLQRYPAHRVLVTTTTPTGSDRVRALFGNTVEHCYAPFDLGWSVRMFFQRYAPCVAIIMETEIWPNLFRECGARRIPLVLASARLSPTSIGRYRALVSLFKETLSHGIVIAAQTPADAERFISLGAAPERTQVTGNIKFDFDLPAGVPEEGALLRQRYAGARPVWIAASTHAGEEEIVLAAHRRVQQRYADALLVLVPRHPERFDGVAALLERQRWQAVRRSRESKADAATEVLLVDTMGELMAFYAAGDVAFVAGSLVKVGGHNLLEPAALRLPMLSGPHTFNAQDIAELLRGEGVVTIVANADQLAEAVIALFNDPAERLRQGKLAEALIRDSRGALDRLLGLIDPLLSGSGTAADPRHPD